VKEFEINFIAESFLADTVRCYNTIDHDKSAVVAKGVRESDGKMVFAARLGALEIDK